MLRPLVALLVIGASFALGAEAEKPNKQRNDQLALDGYCAVSLVEHNVWIKGEPDLLVDHKGLRYLFLSEEERELFRQSPKRFSLVLGGKDVVATYGNAADKTASSVKGERQFAVRHEGRTYLFSTFQNMESFLRSPDRYVQHIESIEDLEKRLEVLELKRGKTLEELEKN